MFVVPFFAEQPVTCRVHVEILLINSEVVSIYLQMNKKCSASQNTGFWCTKRSNILISQYLHKFSQSLAINVWQQVGTTLARSIMACTTLSPSQSPIEPPTWTKSSNIDWTWPSQGRVAVTTEGKILALPKDKKTREKNCQKGSITVFLHQMGLKWTMNDYVFVLGTFWKPLILPRRNNNGRSEESMSNIP